MDLWAEPAPAWGATGQPGWTLAGRLASAAPGGPCDHHPPFLRSQSDLAVRGLGLAIVPLAGLMGEATEQLAERLGPGVGGLLNATFGNAAELIIALFALFKGYDEVVKASLTGSIIGNVLLVLGRASWPAG